MSTLEVSGLVEVHVLELPVPLAARAQQHVEELLREFALIQAGAAHLDGSSLHVPRRLMELVQTLTARFAGVNDAARDRLDAAIVRGDAVIADHVLTLPPEAGPASVALGAMLDECDAWCRQGKDLLTLATPPQLLAYRRWYLAEVVTQLDGGPATSWPDFLAGQDARLEA